MTEIQENVAAASNDQGKVKLHNTSAYDAITEVLGHGIKHFEYLDHFFKGQVGKKGCWYSMYEFCYPTALLNYAKTGPGEEAYKTRTDILKEISEERHRYRAGPVEPYFYKVYELLDQLNMACPFIFKEKSCFDCQLQITHHLRSLNLLGLSRNTSIWKNYNILQPMLDRYFARKTKQCCRCRENYDSYDVDPGPLLCINVETLYERIHDSIGNPPTNNETLLAVACSKMMHSKLDMLPRRLTVRRSTYVLYGVIERCKDKRDEELQYAAYCRNPDDTWERRDGFEGERKLLTDLSIDSIALVFYADIGCWDESQRKKLLAPARSAWHELTKVDLPELCLQKIFSFLDNWALKALIRGVEEKSEGRFVMSSPTVTEADRDDMSVFSFRSDSSEYKEQDRRSRNVLIYNLPTGDDISDIDRVKSLLILLPISRYMDLDKIRVRRYRERTKDDEFPVTVVTFQTQVEAEWCICMRRKLPSKDIKIEGDYTNWQRKQLEKFKNIARGHNKANPWDRKTAFIKCGVPVLVKKRNCPRAKTKPSQTTVGCSEVFGHGADVADEKKE